MRGSAHGASFPCSEGGGKRVVRLCCIARVRVNQRRTPHHQDEERGRGLDRCHSDVGDGAPDHPAMYQNRLLLGMIFVQCAWTEKKRGRRENTVQHLRKISMDQG